MRSFFWATALAVAVVPLASATNLTDAKLQEVYDLMNKLNTYTWENGTRAEAILEWHNSKVDLSPFGMKDWPASVSQDDIPEVLQLAQAALAQRPAEVSQLPPNASNTTSSGDPSGTSSGDASQSSAPSRRRSPSRHGQEERAATPVGRPLERRQDASGDSATPTSASSAATTSSASVPNASVTIPYYNNTQLPVGYPLLKDGAAGDPASLGVALIVSSWATNDGSSNNIKYSHAAESELNYLLYHVPRAANGAISHRTNEVALWADNIYMVPPFLAYYGAAQRNATLLHLAYQQIKTYRELLKHDNNLWQHIALGKEANDPSLWATGNAWVVAGIVRVMATIENSGLKSQLESEFNDLKSWAGEVLSACQSLISKHGLLHNHLDDSSTFEDSAASALMASAALRLTSMGETSYVDMGLTLLAGASVNVNHDGYLTKVVDPLKFTVEGSESPEGQSFIILGYAAYRDWRKAGMPGNTKGKDPLGKPSAAARAIVGGSVAGVLAGVVAAVALIM